MIVSLFLIIFNYELLVEFLAADKDFDFCKGFNYEFLVLLNKKVR